MRMENNVVLIGNGPLFWEVRDFLSDHHIRVLGIDNYSGENLRAVIDIEIDDQKKKSALHSIEDKITDQLPIFTSPLHRTVTEIASWLQHPERVIGFSPLILYKMNILEISLPLQAEDQRDLQQHLLFWKELGKEIEIVGDEPGLVFPRILALIINEAAFALSEGVASKEDIDLAMKKGTNYPFGPLEWADEVGIDQILAILTGLYREIGEDRYRPAPLLRKMGYAGHYGQAAGKGFYSYKRTSSMIEW